MNDTQTRTTLDMATASKLLGVHLQTALSLVQRGLLPAERVADRWRTTPEAIELYRQRVLVEGAFADLAAAHPAATRLLRAMASAEVELAALVAEAGAARASGDFDRALWLGELLDVLRHASVAFDAPAGKWEATLPRPIPGLTVAPSDTATA